MRFVKPRSPLAPPSSTVCFILTFSMFQRETIFFSLKPSSLFLYLNPVFKFDSLKLSWQLLTSRYSNILSAYKTGCRSRTTLQCTPTMLDERGAATTCMHWPLGTSCRQCSSQEQSWEGCNHALARTRRCRKAACLKPVGVQRYRAVWNKIFCKHKSI